MKFQNTTECVDTLYSGLYNRIGEEKKNIIEDNEEETEIPVKTFSSIAKEDDILQMYLKDIGKVKLLNSKEEKSLGKDIKEGEDKKAQIAKRKLIQANLRLGFCRSEERRKVAT